MLQKFKFISSIRAFSWDFINHSSDFWSGFFSTAIADNITWENQAERLQNVSAALLDNLPSTQPVNSTLAVELGTVVSFLPKPSSRIGGKSEKVPSSPVHAVPTLMLSGLWGKFLGGQAWAGFLPPGGEKLFGVKAKLTQYSLGAALLLAVPITDTLFFYSPLGYQYNNFDIEGAITSENAKDSFKSQTNLVYIAPGIRYIPYKIWTNIMLVKKLTKSKFTIEEDDTTFNLSDNLSDTPVPFATQLNVGIDLPYNLKASIGYEIMLERLSMPKFGIGYQYTIL